MHSLVRILKYLSGNSRFSLESRTARRLISAGLGIMHFSLLILFLVYNVTLMVYANLFSILAYIITFFLSSSKYHLAFFRIVYCEVLIHLLLVSVCVGNDCGFDLYCMAMIPISYYCRYSFSQHGRITHSKMINSLGYSLFSISIYIAISLHSSYTEPLYSLGSTSMQDKIYIINFVVVMIALIAFMSTFVAQVFVLEKELKSQNSILEHLSNTDSLTGLATRRSIDQYITKYISDDSNFSVILSDLDDFKQINDEHGHEFGDSVLEIVAKLFTQNVRKTDIVCRWGGEEILVFLPDCSMETAESISQKISNGINSTKITNRNQTIQFTMTFGIAHSSQAKSINDVIYLADKRLYYGKRNGKNCIICNYEEG